MKLCISFPCPDLNGSVLSKGPQKPGNQNILRWKNLPNIMDCHWNLDDVLTWKCFLHYWETTSYGFSSMGVSDVDHWCFFCCSHSQHDNGMPWKYFPHYWPFVRGNLPKSYDVTVMPSVFLHPNSYIMCLLDGWWKWNSVQHLCLLATDCLIGLGIPIINLRSSDPLKFIMGIPIPIRHPDSKVHGAYMGPTWGWQDPIGPHVGLMNLVIRECFLVNRGPEYDTILYL